MTKHSIPLHAFRNSGADARKWKGRIALLAKRGKETMRTLQFPLEMSEPEAAAINTTPFAVAYNAIEGTGKGTLFDYWAKLHLAGFRFFPSGGAATIFRQQAVFEDASWNAAFCQQSGKDWPWLVPSKLYERFTKAPREVAKKDGSKKSIEFTQENVANESHVSLVGASITDKTPEDQKEFFLKMAGALAEKFDSWKSANEDRIVAMKVIDEFLKSEGLHLPSLENIAVKCSVETKPDNATVAWHDAPMSGVQNLAIGVFATCASRIDNIYDLNGGKLSKLIQESATTPNVTALSWLFGKGLEYFRTTDIDTIMQDFNIPASAKESIKPVVESAQAIPTMTVLGKKNYAPFRPNFGGKIDSWIANYASRLMLLNDILEQIEPGFELPQALLDNETLMSGIDMTGDELKELIEAVYAWVDAAKQGLATLLGRGGNVDDAVQTFEQFSAMMDTLNGTLNTISARYVRAVEMAGKDEARLEKLIECKFDIPKWCKSVPKLVGISGGLPKVEEEIKVMNAAFKDVRARMFVRFEEIAAYVASKGAGMDVYDALEKRELEQLKKLKSAVPERAHIQAYRAVLHRIGRAVQNCSEKTKQLFSSKVIEMGVFKNPSHLNNFIFNQKGAIYRSPFDRSRHAPYQLHADKLLKNDWMELLAEISTTLMASESTEQMEDALRLERTRLQLQLSGLPDWEYPASLAKPDIEVEIQTALKMQLAKDTVTSDVLQRTFNLYSSVLSGLTFKLLRRSFSLKMRFSVADTTQLIYVPKDCDWAIPKQYLQAEGEIGIAARVVTESSPAKMVTEVEMKEPKALGHFMQQAPHDWYFDASLGGTQVAGRIVEKGKEVGKERKLVGYRMRGNSAYKTVLDKSLVGNTELSQCSMIIEIPYTQTVDADFRAQVQAGLPKVSINLPVKETITASNKDEQMLFDRFVAIDLGERGLGYAVFDAKTLELQESGHRPIKAITNLLNRTRHYEQRPNQRQKFQAKFNVNLSELRENTVGDVCHQINRICAYYNAFPVLEYMVPDRLDKQLKSVYESVTNRYIWSSTDAHKSARVQFWLGGETWEHPYLKSAKDKKPLVLSPGRGASGKGTSQTCSCCGRNPFDLIKDMKPRAKIAVVDGKAKLENSELKLFERNRESKDDMLARRHRNERAGMEQPLTPGNYTVDEIKALLRANLRRAPKNRRTKDTTVSEYHCVFSDCGKTMHADENAAVNIGGKFIADIEK